MYYENFASLCKTHNVRPSDVSKATGISTATLTSWKQGKYTPKNDKLQKIANYFGVTLEYLLAGEISRHHKEYYLNDETVKIAQEIFGDRDKRILFDAARGSTPEDLRLATEFLTRLKETNRDA